MFNNRENARSVFIYLYIYSFVYLFIILLSNFSGASILNISMSEFIFDFHLVGQAWTG